MNKFEKLKNDVKNYKYLIKYPNIADTTSCLNILDKSKLSSWNEDEVENYIEQLKKAIAKEREELPTLRRKFYKTLYNLIEEELSVTPDQSKSLLFNIICVSESQLFEKPLIERDLILIDDIESYCKYHKLHINDEYEDNSDEQSEYEETIDELLKHICNVINNSDGDSDYELTIFY